MTETTSTDEIRAIARPDCSLCGKPGEVLYAKQRDRLFDAPGEWDVMQCYGCQLLWLGTVPIDADMAKVYPPSQSNSSITNAIAEAGLKNFIRSCILRAVFGYRNLPVPLGGALLGWLAGRLPPLRQRAAFYVNFLSGPDLEGGKLLDVGCGSGEFLARMSRLGWDAHGVEPDLNSADVAERLPGITVHRCTLEDAGFPNDHFNAITLNHVIEHLESPERTLREITRVLKPGGMVIITTPNIAGPCHRRFRNNWYHLDLPRHLIMFSMQSLKSLTTACGLSVRRLFTVSREIEQTYLASSLIARCGRLRGFFASSKGTLLKDRLAAFWFALTLDQSRPEIAAGQGEEIVIVLSK
jgi:2-polyprenyl-3-methyl-5-hydroxy-6-metoxy-1,4-benzoquinol methylase